MDELTGGGADWLTSAWWMALLNITQAEFSWLVATFFASAGSTLVYNIVKWHILKPPETEKWSLKTWPLWFLLWLHKGLLLVGLVLFAWHLYLLAKET